MNNNEVNLMDSLYRAVEQVCGFQAAQRLATMPKPRVNDDTTDWEMVWEDKMLAKFDYIPDRNNHPGHY